MIDSLACFRVALPNPNIFFNVCVKVNLMKLESRSDLHAVDAATKFGAAELLSHETTSEIWRTFYLLLTQAYVATDKNIATDQETAFGTAEWGELLRAHGIRSRMSGVKVENALGEGERYHSFSRRVYLKVKKGKPEIDDKHALEIFVIAVNDTAGSEGLVPMLFIFTLSPAYPFAHFFYSKITSEWRSFVSLTLKYRRWLLVTATSRIYHAMSQARRTYVYASAKKLSGIAKNPIGGGLAPLSLREWLACLSDSTAATAR